MLAIGCKPGGPFKRVGKGTYTLADAAAGDTPTKPDKRAATARAKGNLTRRSGTLQVMQRRGDVYIAPVDPVPADGSMIDPERARFWAS